jgi:hypothetical protein
MSTKKRRPLTKGDLLPLAIAKVQKLSLENHLAMEVLFSHHHTDDHAAHILRVIYFAYCLRGVVEGDRELDLYRQAEAALDAYIARIRENSSNAPTEDERLAINRLLTPHDAQLAAVKNHRYLEALDVLHNSVNGATQSPIPAK